jgi:hypothetical protein
VEANFWNSIGRVGAAFAVHGLAAQVIFQHDHRVKRGEVNLTNPVMDSKFRLIDESTSIGSEKTISVLEIFRLRLAPRDQYFSFDSAVYLK